MSDAKFLPVSGVLLGICEHYKCRETYLHSPHPVGTYLAHLVYIQYKEPEQTFKLFSLTYIVFMKS